MNEIPSIDRWIREQLAQVEPLLPAALETRVRRELAVQQPPVRPRPKPVIWIWAGLAAALLATGAWLYPLRFSAPEPPAPAISEIRTHFEIPGKNITIVWVLRADFDLRRNHT